MITALKIAFIGLVGLFVYETFFYPPKPTQEEIDELIDWLKQKE